MTLTCPGPTCPFCTGELCRECPDDVDRADGCGHNTKERHGTRDTLDDLDNAIDGALDVAFNDDEPAESRVRTLKLPPATKPPPILAARVIIEFSGNDNAEEAAIFFETLAKLIRLKRKFVVICE